MGFEIFNKMQDSFRAKVSIRSNGNIGFSKGARNKFRLIDKKFCKLYYDRDTERIGVEFTNEENANVTTRVFERQMDAFIRAKPFLNYYSIDYSSTKVYLAEKDESTGYIIIDLRDPLYESSRGKRKKSKEVRRYD